MSNWDVKGVGVAPESSIRHADCYLLPQKGQMGGAMVLSQSSYNIKHKDRKSLITNLEERSPGGVGESPETLEIIMAVPCSFSQLLSV